MVEISVYSPEMHNQWNEFVANAKNSTFMHLREYMDYHQQRFYDFSLMAHSRNKLIGILPANRVGDTLYSHQGLTFGGWLMPLKHFDIIDMLEVFDKMAEFLESSGIKHLYYKPSPHIYHSYPAEEDLYAIFRHNGVLVVSNISATINIENQLRFNENSRRNIKLATNSGIYVEETTDFKPFWDILTHILNSKYDKNPVHSLDEIKLLHASFPSNIRLFVAKDREETLGGVLIYDTGIVAHAQYIGANEEGREKGALPLIFHKLISEIFMSRKYFDFGISNENNGLYLNEGLSRQKTGMGARGITYNTYRLDF